MKTFVVLSILAFALKTKGDVTVGVSTVMCNCGAPNTDNYNAFNAANADCTGYPHGSPGHGSCITNALGFMETDGRSANVEGLTGMYAEAADGCDSAAISAANFEAKNWVWPGNFDFNALDSALSSFYECANAAAVVACESALSAKLGECNA